MVTVKDWLAATAEDLAEMCGCDVHGVETVIRRRFPFQIDTAYMPVPRCDQCRHWTPERSSVKSPKFGSCELIIIQTGLAQIRATTQADFGCVHFTAPDAPP